MTRADPPATRGESSITLVVQRMTRSRGIAIAVLVGLGLSAGLAGTWLVAGRTRVVARADQATAAAEPARGWTTGYLIVPERAAEPSRPSPLELRLRVFARAIAQARASTDPPLVAFGAEALTAEIDQALVRVVDRADVSVHVRDLDSSRILFDYHGDALLNPASNNKLLTGAAALDLLGSDYVFETRLVVVGDALYMIGEGDPTLDGDSLRRLASEVAERVPIASLTKIVVDDSAFSPKLFAPGYPIDATDEAYVAPSGALSLAFNSIEITVYPLGKRETGVAFEPASTHVVLDNAAQVGRGRLTIHSIRDGSGPPSDRARTRIAITGKLGRRSVSVRRRVYDPGAFTGGALAFALAEASHREPLPVEFGVLPAVEREPGVELDESTPSLPRRLGRTVQGVDIELVALRRSAPLIEVVGHMLTWSNNSIAEQLVRTLGWRMTGAPGDWTEGCEVVRSYWQAIGQDPNALIYENGAGLSRVGRVTTRGLVDLLALTYRTQTRGASLIDALPVAGSMGTLRGRLRRSGQRVRAKTGTMAGVSGLTGVITSDTGEPMVAFSILINVRESGRMVADSRRKIEDSIVMAVLGHIDNWEAVRGELILDLEPLDISAVEQPD